MSDPLIPVRYIFRRPYWKDNIYGSGLEFVNEEGAAAGRPGLQIRMVPEPLALKFLRHTDTFERAEPQETQPQTEQEQTDEALAAAEAKKREEAERQAQLYALYDQINLMDKDALTQFVTDRYSVALDQAKSIEDMRVEATAIIDRFGVT